MKGILGNLRRDSMGFRFLCDIFSAAKNTEVFLRKQYVSVRYTLTKIEWLYARDFVSARRINVGWLMEFLL